LIERDEAVRAALCALIAGQNMVLMGPPGTAKSYLVFLLAQSLMAASLSREVEANLSDLKGLLDGKVEQRSVPGKGLG